MFTCMSTFDSSSRIILMRFVDLTKALCKVKMSNNDMKEITIDNNDDSSSTTSIESSSSSEESYSSDSESASVTSDKSGGKGSDSSASSEARTETRGGNRDDERDDDMDSLHTEKFLAADPLYFILSRVFITDDGKNIATILSEINDKLTILTRDKV